MALSGYAAPAAATNELEVQRSAYATELARIDGAFVTQRTNALACYRQSIDTLLQALKKTGDMDSYLVLEREKERCLKEGTVCTNGNPALVASVARYRKSIADASVAREKATQKLLELHVERLSALMRKHMQEDRIQDAKKVREELAEAKADLLFMMEEKRPAAPIAAQPPPAQPAVNPYKAVVGTWTFTWRNRGRVGTERVTIKADGTAYAQESGQNGRWEIKERQCIITWPRTVGSMVAAASNSMAISDDGEHMSGHNRLTNAILAAEKTAQ